MSFTINLSFFFFFLAVLVAGDAAADGGKNSFTFNGFHGANLSLGGIAEITSDGLLVLTNITKDALGHAFYPLPLALVPSSDERPAISFSTTFAFAIVPEYPDMNGHGLALVFSPSKELPGAVWQQYLGLFNASSNGNGSNHVLAVELDTVQDKVFNDINDNHVGIDVNGLKSRNSSRAAYFDPAAKAMRSLKLISGDTMLLWVDYQGETTQLDVTLAPLRQPKPASPLVSAKIDISQILLGETYVGFSASTGAAAEEHYILGWSFSLGGGDAPPLDVSKLPRVPRRKKGTSQGTWLALSAALPPAAVIALVISALLLVYLVRRRRKFAEVVEDWERDLGPHRFSYRVLYKATKGFREVNLLGAGGFGKVYSGTLPRHDRTEIAVKRVSHESTQGVRQFVSEIVSMGRLRHRNLVQLLGYCRRQGELLLVYEYMPNGSLDKYLFSGDLPPLSWSRRLGAIKGVAAGLLYLHEGWEQVVIHRDIKASNVLLDGEFNAKLGDFGLARLYDHGADPHTTHIMGTLGYLAPEITATGRATTKSDVYALGAFLLEVACGRRPMDVRWPAADAPPLADFVLGCWMKGVVLEAADPRLGRSYSAAEMELVLKLGALCMLPDPVSRPSMRQVVQLLEGEAPFPVISPEGLLLCSSSTKRYDDFFGDFVSIPSTVDSMKTSNSSQFFS